MKFALATVLCLLLACAPASTSTERDAQAITTTPDPDAPPAWLAPADAFERTMLEAVREFDPSLRGANAQELDRGTREIVSVGLKTRDLALMIGSLEGGRSLFTLVSLGGPPDAFAVRLEAHLRAACDRAFPRSD